MTVEFPARPALAMPVGLTESTLVSVLVQATPVTGVPMLAVTVSGAVSPARSVLRTAVTCSALPDGEVGVVELLSQPARQRASPASAVATRRDVTPRL